MNEESQKQNPPTNTHSTKRNTHFRIQRQNTLWIDKLLGVVQMWRELTAKSGTIIGETVNKITIKSNIDGSQCAQIVWLTSLQMWSEITFECILKRFVCIDFSTLPNTFSLFGSHEWPWSNGGRNIKNTPRNKVNIAHFVFAVFFLGVFTICIPFDRSFVWISFFSS